MHPEFLFAKENIYIPNGLSCSNEQAEPESSEYAAATFLLRGKKIIFRAAKITPTKIGQFVTIWKRNQAGITSPFESIDTFDFIIIVTRKENQVGQFIFPKSILLDKGIVSGNDRDGKRGIRIYPPWDKTESKQALKTQQWQLDFFINYSIDTEIDHIRLRTLLMN